MGNRIMPKLNELRQVFRWTKLLRNFTARRDSLRKSDIIFVFGSNRPEVAWKAAELYGRDLSERIIFTGGIGGRLGVSPILPEANFLTCEAVRCGVPLETMLVEPESTDTQKNIENAFQILRENNIYVQQIIAVAQPAQQLRQWATLMKRVSYVTALNCSADIELPSEGDKLLEESCLVVGEVRRLLEYPAKGFIIEVPIPQDTLNTYLLLRRMLLDLGYSEKDL